MDGAVLSLAGRVQAPDGGPASGTSRQSTHSNGHGIAQNHTGWHEEVEAVHSLPVVSASSVNREEGH